MIATTEVTRASVEGEREVAREVAEQGIEMVEVWQTSNDEMVCFPAWTLVETLEGQTPIQNVRAGDFVKTRQGYKLVTATSARGYDGEMATLMADGASVTCTAEHPIFEADKGWLQAGKFKAGDRVQLANDKTAEVRSVVNFSLFNTRHTPAMFSQIVGLAGVSPGVLMPVLPIYLQRDTCRRDKEVNAVPANPALLNKGNSRCLKNNADGPLKHRLALESSVAGERTKLSGVGFGGANPELLPAIAAFLEDRRATALLRAEMAIEALFCNEDLAAPFALGVFSASEPTLHTANRIAFGNAGENSKRLAANGAHLSDALGIIALALAATEAPSLLKLRGSLVRFLATIRAGDHRAGLGRGVIARAGTVGEFALRLAGTAEWFATVIADVLKRHSAPTLTKMLLLYHRLSGTQVTVYNLQVEGAPEFYANGILVHNCPICGPLHGKPLGDGWTHADGPPRHPNCRCWVNHELRRRDDPNQS
jgi:intein/homing endonuclease